jgi:hypothetical protein
MPLMEQPESTHTLRKFTLSPQLPFELRLSIWGFALPESRIVTIKQDWNDVNQRFSFRFGKSDKPPVLLQVNREPRSMALRTYHLSFDSEELFNCPKYFNNAKDTLHVMSFHVYSESQPWLSNTSIVMEDFKRSDILPCRAALAITLCGCQFQNWKL